MNTRQKLIDGLTAKGYNPELSIPYIVNCYLSELSTNQVCTSVSKDMFYKLEKQTQKDVKEIIEAK